MSTSSDSDLFAAKDLLKTTRIIGIYDVVSGRLRDCCAQPANLWTVLVLSRAYAGIAVTCVLSGTAGGAVFTDSRGAFPVITPVIQP